MDIFDDFNHLNLGEKAMKIAARVFPDANLPKVIERFEAAAKNAGSEVFVIRDEAIPGPKGGNDKKVKFVQANFMKVSEANSGKYASMEREIFKPMHKARIEAGKMHDWVLLQRIMPYGSEWDNNFLTFDVFNEWGDMAGGPDNLFEKVHPGKDANALWNKMAKLRELRRSETWEFMTVVDSPTPEVTYNVIKEGVGDYPMKGQEIAYKGKFMNLEGETLFSTETLGFNFYHTLGSNPYDRFFDRGLKQMKKGGIMTMTLPPDIQDKNTRNMTGGETAVMKFELVDIGEVKPSGADLLENKIKEHGLMAAKEKYQKLQSNNPKGYVFREDSMNALGYKLMGDGNTEAALYIFELNQKNYPKSWNACDSLADGYRAAGNYAKAKHCYKMALKINPDFQASKDKLEKL